MTPLAAPTFDFALRRGTDRSLVGISIVLAQELWLQNAYWLPVVSCFAVIQGMSLRSVWNKQMHHVLGSGFGPLLSWGLFLAPLD